MTEKWGKWMCSKGRLTLYFLSSLKKYSKKIVLSKTF